MRNQCASDPFPTAAPERGTSPGGQRCVPVVEALVAGGGPAGAAAAIVLARHGVRVLLVEARREPDRLVAGEFLDPQASVELLRLGVAVEHGLRGCRVSGARVTAGPMMAAAGYAEGAAGWSLARADLDAALLAAAGAAGVQVRVGVRAAGLLLQDGVVRGASLDTGAGSIRVPAVVTIAADGCDSALARAAGLGGRAGRRRPVSAALVQGIDLADAAREIHVGRGRWLGLTSLPGGLTSLIAAGIPPPGAGERDGWPRGVLASFPEFAISAAQVRLASPVTVRDEGGATIPAAGAPGLLLAGDAVHAASRLPGDDLWRALRGGVLAGEAALTALERPTLRPHVELARRRLATFRGARGRERRLRALLVLQDLVPVPAVRAAGLRLMARILTYPPHPDAMKV